jgi:Mn2+/Fe2+ NRAMP family transporter
LALCIAVAVAIAYAAIKPITLLFYSGIAGGIATPFTLALLLLIARNKRVMQGMRIPAWLAVCGWSVTAVITGASLAYLSNP